MLVLKPETYENILIKDAVTGEVIVKIQFFYQDKEGHQPSRRLGFTADKRYHIYREPNESDI